MLEQPAVEKAAGFWLVRGMGSFNRSYRNLTNCGKGTVGLGIRSSTLALTLASSLAVSASVRNFSSNRNPDLEFARLVLDVSVVLLKELQNAKSQLHVAIQIPSPVGSNILRSGVTLFG